MGSVGRIRTSDGTETEQWASRSLPYRLLYATAYIVLIAIIRATVLALLLALLYAGHRTNDDEIKLDFPRLTTEGRAPASP